MSDAVCGGTGSHHRDLTLSPAVTQPIRPKAATTIPPKRRYRSASGRQVHRQAERQPLCLPSIIAVLGFVSCSEPILIHE